MGRSGVIVHRERHHGQSAQLSRYAEPRLMIFSQVRSILLRSEIRSTELSLLECRMCLLLVRETRRGFRCRRERESSSRFVVRSSCRAHSLTWFGVQISEERDQRRHAKEKSS